VQVLARNKSRCARLPVSSWSSASVLVNRAAERQGPAFEAMTMVMVVGHFVRPDVAALYYRRPCLSSHCGTSLERSACRRYLVDHSASFQATAQDWTLLMELSWSSSCTRLRHYCVNFRCDTCNVVSQLLA